jgi:hypothetical protein
MYKSMDKQLQKSLSFKSWENLFVIKSYSEKADNCSWNSFLSYLGETYMRRGPISNSCGASAGVRWFRQPGLMSNYFQMLNLANEI